MGASTNKYSLYTHTHTQGGGFLGDLNGKVYGGMDHSIYILPYVPLRDQVSSLLTRQLVEEAAIAAVEAAKEKESPEEVLLLKLVYCSQPVSRPPSIIQPLLICQIHKKIIRLNCLWYNWNVGGRGFRCVSIG